MAIRILFACVGNSCRSQMAEAFCRALGRDVECASAGSRPSAGIHPDTIAVMSELGIDISAARYYYVGKDLKGVNGTIDAERYDGSALSGRFSGTLGWWQPPHDPHEDPPDATFEVEDGFFKQTGMRL